jgi:hypothetical protein
MSRRVAYSLMLANWFKIFYLEEGRGGVIPWLSGTLGTWRIAAVEDELGLEELRGGSNFPLGA